MTLVKTYASSEDLELKLRDLVYWTDADSKSAFIRKMIEREHEREQKRLARTSAAKGKSK